MAKILKPIQQRYFEIIRDRIAEILADELNNQAVLNNDPNLDATIFTERLIPIDVSDMPCVTIGVAGSEFDNFRQLTKDGNYDYQIDVFEKAPSTDSIDGDYASSVKLQRLVGVIDAILSNPIYRTLGFKAPSLSSVEVQGFQMATPTEEQRSKNITMCRMRLRVRVNESVDGVDGVLLAGYQTTVRLGLTNKGYIFSGTAPITPYEPACAGVRVYNSSESFDINVASGDSLLLPDITVTDSDGSTQTAPAMTDVVCTPQIPLVDGVVDIRDTDNILIGSQNVANNSTEDFIVPDSFITLKDTDGLTLQTESLKATQPLNLIAPDATVNITNSDNDLLGSVVVPSGGSDTFEVPNEDITVNGDLLVAKPSAQDYDVEVVDTENNAVSTSISGGKVVVSALPCSIIPTRALTYLVNSGTDGTFEIGISGSGILYSVLTEDGQYFSGQTANLTITFPEINTEYFIEIRGSLPRSIFFFTGATNRAKLLQIIQKGDVVLDVFQSQSYRDCINLSSIIPHDYTLDGVEDVSHIFDNTNISGNLPTGMTLSSVKIAYAAFRNSKISGVANLNFQNTTDIRVMFLNTLLEELHIQNMGNIALINANTFRISTLKKLTCDGLPKGFSIRYSPLLVGVEIDNLFTSLADISGGATEIIEITTAQNTSGINTSIATLKGWTITVV